MGHWQDEKQGVAPGLPSAQEGELVLRPHFSLYLQLLLRPGTSPRLSPFPLLLAVGCTVLAVPGCRCQPVQGSCMRRALHARATAAPSQPGSARIALPLVLHHPATHTHDGHVTLHADSMAPSGWGMAMPALHATCKALTALQLTMFLLLRNAVPHPLACR